MRLAISAALAVAFRLSFPCSTAAAPPEPNDVSLVAAPGWTAKTHHDYARRSLLRGRSFARAALHLQEAARLSPQNPEHRLALGCAYTSRAASLAYAHAMDRQRVQDIKDYPADLSEWEEAREKAEAEGRGADAVWMRPAEPPAEPYPTKDDGRLYRLSDETFRVEWARMRAAALAAWAEAGRLSGTPEQRARAEHVRGWGLWTLHTYGTAAEEEPFGRGEGGDEDNEAPAEEPKARAARETAEKAVIAAFEKAVALAPENAVYWESLGEALRRFAPTGATTEEGGKPRRDWREAHRTALRLRPKNAPLWYLLGLEEGPTSDELDPKAAAKREKALGFFERAAGADPANPAPLYLIASVRFSATPYSTIGSNWNRPSTHPDHTPDKLSERGRLARNRDAGRDALHALERANGRHGAVRSLRYRPPVPVELSAAWAYLGDLTYVLFQDMSALRALARSTTGYARFLADEGKDPAQARRATDAVLTMGAHLTADWPLRDRERGDGAAITALVGQVVTEIGYRAKLYVLGKAGDTAGAERTKAERAAFLERKRDWKAAYQGAMATDAADSY